MTDTSVRDDDWSAPTHYVGKRPLEPRTFTEADPMTSFFLTDWTESGDESRWGTTTYVGRPRRRRKDERKVVEAPPSETPAPTDGRQPEEVEPEGAASPDGEQPESAESGLLANSRSMAIASLASRITGFLRSVMLVAALGTGAVANAYNSGNNLPNMIYELLLGGVLSSILIPLLVHAESEDEDGGLAYTQRLLSIATAALAGMTLLVVAAAPWIAAVFVPPGSQRELATVFATLLLPEIFFYGIGAMLMAVLNIKNIYRPGAWAPLVNNLVVMATILVFWALPGPKTLDPGTMTTPQILVVGIGTTLGIAAQAFVMVPALRRSGFRWQWRFRARPGESDRMREVGSLAAWVFGYVVVSQIGVSVIQKVGVANGGFTIFTNADLLFQMPYGILVVSILTAIMPRLSRAAVRGDNEAVTGDLSLAARLSSVALVPVTAGLIVLGPVLGVALFAHGETSVRSARLMGSALAWSAFGLLPFAIVMLQLRVFYAMRDGRTPTLINAFMVAVKVALVVVTDAVFDVPPGTDVDHHPNAAAVEWLNIATSVSYVIGAVVGHVLLTRRLGRLGFGRVMRTVVQISAASAAGALAAWGVSRLTQDHFGNGPGGSALALVAGSVVGLVVLVGVAWRMRIADVSEVLAAARR